MERKLIRDRVPQIMRARGFDPIVETADVSEYEVLLRRKLAEEVEEFLASGEPEELADILEVILALARTLGLDPAALEVLRAAKAAERGGFDARLVWLGDRDDGR